MGGGRLRGPRDRGESDHTRSEYVSRFSSTVRGAVPTLRGGQMGDATTSLWSDEPTTTDLLSFRAIADTISDVIFDDSLDPVALGLSGRWGSGKTSILNLVDQAVTSRASGEGDVVVVRADPWRYDPDVGPKESLIAEVLSVLQGAIRTDDPVGSTVMASMKRLAKKVNWSKAVKLAAQTAITMQIPSFEAVTGLISDEPESLDSTRGMDQFREEFSQLLNDPALSHVARIVVLVDDLDRCLPDTVVETLEAIRLFLSVSGMSFVIAADEQRVADAIGRHLGLPLLTGEGESEANLYLHKIVHTTVPVPALSRYDTWSYLTLLLAKDAVEPRDFDGLVRQSDAIRMTSGSKEQLEFPNGIPGAEIAALATRLTPILYEKFQGNPRRIKRFMNDVRVRQSVATRRGISLDEATVAKLMVLERTNEAGFSMVLEWLGNGTLRVELEQLDEKARGEFEAEESDGSGDMVRWARLDPPLNVSEVQEYLTLAAAFRGETVLDRTLPQSIRDLADRIASGSDSDYSLVTDADFTGLSLDESQQLLRYLGRRLQQDPRKQFNIVDSVRRLVNVRHELTGEAVTTLRLLPGSEVDSGTVLLLERTGALANVVDSWSESATATTLRAIGSMER